MSLCRCQGILFHFKLWLTCLLIVLGLNACGGSSGLVLGGGFSTGEVRPLEFGSNGEATITFGDLSGDEEFALIFFAANINEGFFDIKLQSSQSSGDTKLLQALSPLVGEDELAEDTTSRFHQALREEEEYLEGLEPYSPNQDSGRKLFMVGDGDQETAIVNPNTNPCANGAGIFINVLNSLSDTTDFTTTCGIEKRRTNRAIYYVDQEVWGTLPEASLNRLIDDFDAKIPVEKQLLGEESDVDRNGLISVYFTPAVNRLGASVGGFITGYFFGGDLFSRRDMPSSNQMEILFLIVPDPHGVWGTSLEDDFWASNIAPTVLTHEYQHMINFNYKVLIAGAGAEETWANEGISHLLEDLDSYQTLGKVSAENPSRVALFLESPQAAAFTGGTSLAQRGGAYLFFRYLYEQADLGRYPNVPSGAELLRGLVQSSSRGTANIEEVTGWSMKILLLDFYVSLQLSNTTLTSDPRYNFQGICLTCKQDDNRGTSLNGVSNQALFSIPTQNSLSSPGGIFFNTLGETIINAGYSLKFIAAPGMIPGGAVVRLE